MSGNTETALNSALATASDIADVAAAATGNPVAGAIALGLNAAGDVAQTVEGGAASGQSAAGLAVSAASSLVSAAAPAVASLPAAQQTQAVGILASIEALVNDFVKLF
jgi:hypothetical protein